MRQHKVSTRKGKPPEPPRLAEYVRALMLRDPKLHARRNGPRIDRARRPGLVDDPSGAIVPRLFWKKWGKFLYDVPFHNIGLSMLGLDAPVTFAFNRGCGANVPVDGWRGFLGDAAQYVRFTWAKSCPPAAGVHNNVVCWHRPDGKARSLRIEVDLGRLPKDRKAFGRAILKLIDFAEKRAVPDDPYIDKLRRTKPARFKRALERYDRWQAEGPGWVPRRLKDQARRDIALIYEAIHRWPYGRTLHAPAKSEQPSYACPQHGVDCPASCAYAQRHLAAWAKALYPDLPTDGTGRTRGEVASPPVR